jgi:hypothetical protein
MTVPLHRGVLRAMVPGLEGEGITPQAAGTRPLLRLLAQGGFGEVTAHRDYTETEATAEHGILIFIARK